MQSPHFPRLDTPPLVFELLHSAWSWAHPLQDPNTLAKAPMRMEHSDLNTHTMLSTNKLLTPLLHILSNKLLPLTTNKQVMHPLHRHTPLSRLLDVLVLWLHLLGNRPSLLDLIDMLLLIRDIVITMNRNPNTRIDIPPHHLLMSGKQGLMHLTMLDLIILDQKVLEVIPDQVYLISPQTQR
jgi:hypothetical protein